jgi:glycosyltransferase involved in cell wall biosynthesis
MPSLGLAMIVKNGAKTLQNCLASVRGVTDQIVIADTGSSDGTPELARSLGATVFDCPWQDDFALARNAAIHALITDWVLMLDDDEELEPGAREKIRPLLDRTDVGGYFVTTRNYLPVKYGSGGHAPAVKPNDCPVPRAEGAPAYADFTLYRLFRRHPEINFVGRVHERVDPQIRALGLKLASSDLVISHFGHLCSEQELQLKDQFYRKLGLLKLQDTPNDPQAWIEMGLQEYEQFRNYSAGVSCFKKALALDPNYSSVPYLSLANLYVETDNNASALELLSATTMKGREAGVREQIRGDALYNLARLKEARAAYIRALSIFPDDARIVSKLGLTEVRIGLKTNGLARLTKSLKASPDLLEIHDRMIKGYILANMMPQAAEAAEHLAIALPNPGTILRAASIRAQMKQWKAAGDFVSRGLEQFPVNPELLQAQAELARETARAASAL